MKVNLDYYKGTDLYSDGDIEKEVIEYLKTESDYEQVFENDIRFPVVYHLTSIRGNILNWYPFKKDATILEIGAGMGAITSTLCENAKRVVSVELSRQRASAIEERCKEKTNLELIVGNLNDIEFHEQFDYITLIGVLEYAPLYTNDENPYATFLNKIKKLLKKDGKLLIAIENKFGMKYFSGIAEDHTGIRYDNIVGYQNKKGVQTFGKNEITELLQQVGLKQTKFYYPLPDYKMPNIIFTDEYLPNKNTITRDIQYYNPAEILNFDEIDVYKEIIKEDKKSFPMIANSFFIEASAEKINNDIKCILFNNWRKEKYQLKTMMFDNEVIKYPNNKKANFHIERMKNIIAIMKEEKIITLDKFENNSIKSKWVNQDNFEDELTLIYHEKGIDEFYNSIENFYKFLKKKLKISADFKTTVFEKYNVDCPIEIKQKLKFVKNGIYDMRFENCFYIDGEYCFYDQEWMEENVPVEFILYRSLINYNEITKNEKEDIFRKLHIDEYIEIFESLERELVHSIKNEKLSQIYAKPRKIEDILENHAKILEEYNQLKSCFNANSTSQLQQKIQELEEEIQNKNKYIDNLSINYHQIINSRSFKMANIIRKAVYIPMKLLRRGKREVRKITNKLNITTEQNSYKRVKAYDSIYQENRDFSGMNTDIKALAFYLPQFHTFKENDEWWGKGFTEWTNAKKSTPRYPGHYQPRLPHEDIGFYDLKDIKTMEKQVKLAKEHGIYGFCFYYYWFSGKRLMEKPVDLLLNHPEIDINFCLCWANENWTRRWDGQNQNVLIAQEYSEDDPVKFIQDIKKYTDDKRYIRVDGKPVIMLYNPSIIPNVNKVIKIWREEAKKIGIGEILVWTRNLLVDNQPVVEEADAEFDFPPLQKGFPQSVLSGITNGYLFNYRILVEEMKKLYKNYKHPKKLYYGTTMGWDNSARRKEGFTIFHGFSLESFYNWNQEVIKKTREMHSADERFIFINAWNEWCEGTYLEPDQKYGYANINTLSKALFDIPFEELKVINNQKSIPTRWTKKIAVQIHLFYPDLCDEIIEQLNYIPYQFDCYITTNSDEKKKQIELAFRKKCKANNVVIEVTTNRGRDVAPFLIQMSKVIDNYDYICHIHSKKTKTGNYGNSWRKYLYKNLFGSQENVIQIFNEFENNKNLGIIYPEIYPVITDQINYYGKNLASCKKEFRKLKIPKNYINEKLVFPAGTMFWAKKEAIEPLFKVGYKYKDFAKERNQIDATSAHAIERIICNLAISRGYTYLKTYNNTISPKLQKKNRKILYYYFETDNKIDQYDIEYLNKLKSVSTDITILANKNIKKRTLEMLSEITSDIVKTDSDNYNIAWKSYLRDNKISNEVEDIIITNNKNMLTRIPIENVLNNIYDNECFVLGYTLEKEDNRKSKKFMDDLIIIKKALIEDRKFKNFLDDLEDDELKKFMDNNNIKYGIYLAETEYINEYIVNVPIDQREPYLMMILGSPLIKKELLEKIDSVQRNKIINFINQIK